MAKMQLRLAEEALKRAQEIRETAARHVVVRPVDFTRVQVFLLVPTPTTSHLRLTNCVLLVGFTARAPCGPSEGS